MCNLSQGAIEKGIQKGIQQGIQRGRQQGLSLGVENLSMAIQRLQRGDMVETLLSDGMDEETVKEAEKIVLSFQSMLS